MRLTLHNSVSGLASRNLSPSSPWRFEGNAVIALKQITASSSALVCPGTATTGSGWGLMLCRSLLLSAASPRPEQKLSTNIEPNCLGRKWIHLEKPTQESSSSSSDPQPDCQHPLQHPQWGRAGLGREGLSWRAPGLVLLSLAPVGSFPLQML